RSLEVVAGPVAADVSPGKLDRPAICRERDALDEEGRGAAGLVQQACLAGLQQDRLERLADTCDGRVVAVGENAVEGLPLQVRSEQTGEAFGRQVDLFEQERLTVGDSQPL